MTPDRLIIMPPKDYARFQEFSAEVGLTDGPQVLKANDAGQWYNPDLESSEMAVRTVVRNATLKHLGYRGEELMGGENIVQSLDTNPDIKDALGTSNYYNYKWHEVIVKNYGPLSTLQRRGDAVVDSQKGVVLFTDEVHKLLEGEPVTTFYSSGLQWMGYLIERKDVFRVVEGQLQRVRGINSLAPRP